MIVAPALVLLPNILDVATGCWVKGSRSWLDSPNDFNTRRSPNNTCKFPLGGIHLTYLGYKPDPLVYGSTSTSSSDMHTHPLPLRLFIRISVLSQSLVRLGAVITKVTGRIYRG